MSRCRLSWSFAYAAMLAVIAWSFVSPALAQEKYQFQIVHSFGATGDGAGPEGPMVMDSKGNLYGVTYTGGASMNGTVFELTPGASGQWTETVLYTFPGYKGDGADPVGIVMDVAGNVFGTTTWGGANDYGTLFELTLGANGQWTESVLWNFCSQPDCSDGRVPLAGPTLGTGGVLYGTAGYTAFELTPGSGGWTLTTLYTFCSQPNCSDGYAPFGSLALDAKGNLYGETELGVYNGGTAFTLRPQPGGQWKEFVLHTFEGGKDGTDPKGGVTVHQGGLYGTTEAGGAVGCLGSGCGTVYELTRGTGNSVNEQILRDFGANEEQGITPLGSVAFDVRGDLFGVTADGGNPTYCGGGCGVVYGMKPQGNGQWAFAVLHSFIGSDGVEPDYGLTIDAKGNLYGTTLGGGQYGYGVAYELSPVEQAR